MWKLFIDGRPIENHLKLDFFLFFFTSFQLVLKFLCSEPVSRMFLRRAKILGEWIDCQSGSKNFRRSSPHICCSFQSVVAGCSYYNSSFYFVQFSFFLFLSFFILFLFSPFRLYLFFTACSLFNNPIIDDFLMPICGAVNQLNTQSR